MREFSFDKVKAIMADKESEYHLTFPRFRRKRELELHDKIQGKAVIFLDLKYLVIFRDLLFGNGIPNVAKSDLPYYTEILNTLTDLKSRNKVVCLISSSIITEMDKIEEEKRKATARVFDKIGQGIVFNNIYINLKELTNVDRAITGAQLFPRYHLSTVFESNPIFSQTVLKEFDGLPNAAKNIAFDELNTSKLEDYVSGINSKREDSGEIIAKIFNQSKDQNTDTLQFKPLLTRELNSIISSYKKMKLHALENKISVEKHLKLFIKHAPHMYLMAAIHAAMAINRDQRYKSNDYYDLLHSCSAVGYAEFLITEKRFHHLLKSGPVNATKLYKVKILSEPKEVLQQLEKLAEG